jgi:transcriptional antiterminator NusG
MIPKSGLRFSDKIMLKQKDARGTGEDRERLLERPKTAVTFEVGELVRVSDGPFASFNGTVEKVDRAGSRIEVAVSIYGRATPVELEFGQVQKL